GGASAAVEENRPSRLSRERIRMPAVLGRHRRGGRGHQGITAEGRLADGRRAVVALARVLRTVGDERLRVGALAVVTRHRPGDLEVGPVLLYEQLHDRRLLRLALLRIPSPFVVMGRELALRAVEGPSPTELGLGLRRQAGDGKNEHGRHEAHRTFYMLHAILLFELS